MDKEEFKEQFQQGVTKVVDASKKAATKAGVALQDFSDKSVIKFEIHQFDSKIKSDYTKLGKMMAEQFIKDSESAMTASDTGISPILEEIVTYKKEIAKRNALLAEKSDNK